MRYSNASYRRQFVNFLGLLGMFLICGLEPFDHNCAWLCNSIRGFEKMRIEIIRMTIFILVFELCVDFVSVFCES